MVDTPGIIPRGDEEELALRSALRPESLDAPIPVAVKLLRRAMEKRPEVIRETYGVEEGDPYRVLEGIARRRGLYLKGGELNVEEAARIVIRDWQTGRLVFYYTPRDYGLG